MSNPSIAVEKQLEWHRKFLTLPSTYVAQKAARSNNWHIQTDYNGDKDIAANDVTFGRIMNVTLASALEVGVSYFWSAEICDLMSQVSRTIPEFTLRPEVIPYPDGVFYFDKPITLANGHIILGIVWHLYTVQVDPDVLKDEDLNEDDWKWVENFNDQHKHGTLMFVTIEQHPTDDLFISSGIVWTLGNNSSQPKQYLITNDPDAQATNEVDLLASCFSFIEQRILVSEKQGLDRPARRRLAKSHPTKAPEVYTILLRRKQKVNTADAESEHEPREWSCRWIVRGFWRQQYYPATKVHKPKWIFPFIKGPEDKPLKLSRSTVYAVVR